MKKFPTSYLHLLLILLLSLGVFAQAQEAFEVSEVATQAETGLDAKVAQPTAALPPDHWLVGTSWEEDMVPAVLAPEAPRKLLKEHGAGYLEQIGDTRVLHLKGSYYDMGFQHGTLMKEEIFDAAKRIQLVGRMGWKKNFEKSLEEAWERSKAHIPEKFKQEMQGLSDATGMSVEQVRGFTLFSELFHCSGFALWGKATADGELLHGRVLDYMRYAGLDRYALVIVHEPEGANAFANVAYSGMLGCVTGMSEKQIGIGEMGGGGSEQWDGMPMALLLRECLETADTLADVRRILTETPRTCRYFYVISDAKAKEGRGDAFSVDASPEKIQFVEQNEKDGKFYRPFEDAVLISGGERYGCLADRVEKMYGKITPQIALDIMARGVSMKSNMHNALFRPKTLDFWVANCTVRIPSCNRPYTHYNLNELLKEKPGK